MFDTVWARYFRRGEVHVSDLTGSTRSVGGRPRKDSLPPPPGSGRGTSTARSGPGTREFDPRRDVRRRLLQVALPADVDGRDLDRAVWADLRALPKETAERTAAHLVVAGRLIDTDPVQALAHARAATALAGRVGAVREAAGLTAYAAGEWALGRSELRTARRITGRADHLAVLADCERALGRPERALLTLDDPDVPRLDQSSRVELVIVVAGARRDLGELEAAVLLLQGPAQSTRARHPWAARLWFAYADALAAAGRPVAREWFARAASVDAAGATDAAERLLEMDGVVFCLEEPADEDEQDRQSTTTLEELGLSPVSAADLSVGGVREESTHARPSRST